MYELIHGHSPFRAKKINEIYSNIVNKPMKFSSRASDDVRDLLKNILQFKPANRLSMEGILEHPWVKKYSKLQMLQELTNVAKNKPVTTETTTTRAIMPK